MKEQTTTRPEWTIMVYVAADDGLANFAVESLKQLRNTAGGKIAVTAELGVEDSEHPLSRRYLFSQENPSGRLRSDRHPNGTEVKWEPPKDTNITCPDRLKDFILWSREFAEADKYCLILWGHGPVLDYQPPKANGRRALYLSPLDLGNALRAAGAEKEEKKFKIIALDACSMSMVEYAAELENLADYMIASQEEVPDLSFPYDTLVKRFRDHGNNVEFLCETGVIDYVDAYQDCICNAATGTKPCMLSALRLEGIADLRIALTELVKKLRSLADREDVGKAIYKARVLSQGFVGGLCVDLSDFCHQLSRELEAIHGDEAKLAARLCGKVRAAIESKTVIKNEVAKQLWRNHESDADKVVNPSSCHGLSVYFPYLKDAEEKQIKTFELVKGASGPGGDFPAKTSQMVNEEEKQIGTFKLVKGASGPGGDFPAKGASGPGGDFPAKMSQMVNEAATDLRFAVRHALIADIESFDQPDPEDKTFQFEKTGWYDFIKSDWCRILAEKEPNQLDVRYWGLQCARNLVNAKPKAVPAQNAPVAVVS